MKLIEGAIYIGKFHDKPVRYLGYLPNIYINNNFEYSEIYEHKFEYIMPEDLPGPQGGVGGYGQTESQMITEEYKLHEILNTLYGI